MNADQTYFSEILSKCHGKGWNVYWREEMIHDPTQTIKENLVYELRTDSRYVLLPEAENPREPEQVFEALERLAIKLDREMPKISLCGEQVPFTGFSLYPRYVKAHTPMGHYVPYPSFVKALDTLVDTK